jgi:hypothetical protein
MIGARGFFKDRKLFSMSLIPEEWRPETRSTEVIFFSMYLLKKYPRGA